MLNIQEYVDTGDYSTFRIEGGKFRYFAVIDNKEDLPQIYTIAHNYGRYKNIPIFILGGGSNVVFSDGVINVWAVKNEIKGFKIINETSTYVDVQVGAGEAWDDLVLKTVEMNLSGLEALSAIPGTVGAGPVQNIGAYGSEVKDTILNVEVFDIKSGNIKNISNSECKFGYRDSVFKNEAKGRYIITSVIYRLNKIASPEGFLFAPVNVPNYPGVIKYFESRKIQNPTLKEIRDAIIYIRKEKLPDPREIPNTGSFFKNPIIENKIALKIKEEYPRVVFFPIDDNYTKIPAGWLIENAGLKGKSFGEVSVYDKNALVLVNNGNANCIDVLKAKEEIIKIVFEKFGIKLEQEPEII
jgi:UDP-N-acetylmuramate dehydrogenase